MTLRVMTFELTFLNICSHGPKEIDNVGMFPQVRHYLEL